MSRYAELLSKPRSKNYICGDFVVDAWREIFRKELPQRVKEALSSNHTRHFMSVRDEAVRLDGPESPSMVTFWRAGQPHIGLYYKGNVWHLARDTGQCVPFGMLEQHYPVIRFYGVKYG